jgi:hypothetical protein
MYAYVYMEMGIYEYILDRAFCVHLSSNRCIYMIFLLCFIYLCHFLLTKPISILDHYSIDGDDII